MPSRSTSKILRTAKRRLLLVLQLQSRVFRDKREAKFRDDELEANKTAWGITDVEYKIAQASLETLSADKYAALIEQAEAFGIADLAILHGEQSEDWLRLR